jgi:hypothetical protein
MEPNNLLPDSQDPASGIYLQPYCIRPLSKIKPISLTSILISIHLRLDRTIEKVSSLQVGPGKPGVTEIKWDTPAAGLCS